MRQQHNNMPVISLTFSLFLPSYTSCPYVDFELLYCIVIISFGLMNHCPGIWEVIKSRGVCGNVHAVLWGERVCILCLFKYMFKVKKHTFHYMYAISKILELNSTNLWKFINRHLWNSAPCLGSANNQASEREKEKWKKGMSSLCFFSRLNIPLTSRTG